MAKRKIHQTRVGSCTVQIYRDTDFDEYIIKTTIPKRTKMTAFETDKAAARSTAAAQIRWLRKGRWC